MSLAQQSQMAYELAMEYLRQNNMLKEVAVSGIPDAVDQLGDVFQAFYDALTKSSKKFEKLS